MQCSLGAARYTKHAVVATCWLQHVSHKAGSVATSTNVTSQLRNQYATVATAHTHAAAARAQHWHTRTTCWNSAVQSLLSTCQQLLAAL